MKHTFNLNFFERYSLLLWVLGAQFRDFAALYKIIAAWLTAGTNPYWKYLNISILNISWYLPEYHFHIPSLAPAPNPPPHVSVTGGRDEVVALTRFEFHLLGWRGKRPEIIFFNKYFFFILISNLNVIVKYMKFLGWSQTAMILGLGLMMVHVSNSSFSTL